jgi:SulP family sulfate permease
MRWPALTLVAVAVPGQMATAQLAGLPAVAGLDAFVAGSLLYALLGTNRHLSVGADSTIAPLLATGVASVAAAGASGYGTVMAVTALLVGGLLVAAGLCRLGWISELLSTPVITGVLAGIAVEIVVRQIPVILGVSGGGTTTIDRIRQVTGQLSHVNGWSVGIDGHDGQDQRGQRPRQPVADALGRGDDGQDPDGDAH